MSSECLVRPTDIRLISIAMLLGADFVRRTCRLAVTVAVVSAVAAAAALLLLRLLVLLPPLLLLQDSLITVH